MSSPLTNSDEALAEAIKVQVKLGGERAETAAAIARHFARHYYRRQSNHGWTEVSFYAAAGLTAVGEVK